jgi:hypothetical protein
MNVKVVNLYIYLNLDAQFVLKYCKLVQFSLDFFIFLNVILLLNYRVQDVYDLLLTCIIIIYNDRRMPGP